MSRPGVHLRRFASRLFAPTTMEYVIGPALADLQLECLAAKSTTPGRRSGVYLRAYLSFWSAVVVHLWSHLMDGSFDRNSVDRRTLARVFVSGTAALGIVTVVIVLAMPLTMVGSLARLRIAFGGDVFRAFALLVPQAMPVSIPAGVLFGALWGVRQRPASRPVRRTILLIGLCGSLLSVALFEWGIPRANQAFRVVVFQNGDRRPLPPAKGPNELTWHELSKGIEQQARIGRSSEVRQLRLAYQGRIAFVLTPAIFAVLALVAARRRRTPLSTIGTSIGLLAYVSYYSLVGWWPLVTAGILSPVTVAWTPNIIALILILATSASPPRLGQNLELGRAGRAAEATLATVTRLAALSAGLVFVASHLGEVVPAISDDPRIRFIHFTADMTRDQPCFDYRLRAGVSVQRLGMTLLKQERVLELLDGLAKAERHS